MLKRLRRVIDFVHYAIGEFWTYAFHSPADVQEAIRKSHLVQKFRKETGKGAHNDTKTAEKIFKELPDENKI